MTAAARRRSMMASRSPVERYCFGLAILGIFGPEVNHIIAHICPSQRRNRTFAPTSEEAEAGEVLEIFRKVRYDGFKIRRLKESLPFIANFGEPRNVRRRGHHLISNCYLEQLPKQLRSVVDCRVAIAFVCTLSSGTCTVTWNKPFISAPNCHATWNGAGTLTGIVNAVPSTMTCVVTSSVGTDTAGLVGC